MLREPVAPFSQGSGEPYGSKAAMEESRLGFFESNAAGAPPDAVAVMHGTLVRGRS
jgi:hypothetical protein